MSSNRITRSRAWLNESDEEDDVSTVRPKRRASGFILETSEINETASKGFSFEQDLSESRVYKRVRRKELSGSDSSSAATSLGWSCLSNMTFADISMMSVISLPITANELFNGEHYGMLSTAQLILEEMDMHRLSVSGAGPGNELHKNAPTMAPCPARRIIILG